ncbi:hypothetical protein [Nitrosospira sp. NpAV]|uniref:hypothetical protein n=1 Tax=Nitrosospira sp. NpAV TaxID=58133 RepID=UPI0005A03931|nr:hypothetical protein [Nitrosospira sp. NpAV]KIO49614.1 hypothetical protein SQ11_05710 [Nitrosospira sp. NpAV]
MTITKEQWKEVELSLSYSFGQVKLRCDGYEITAQVRAGIAPLRSYIYVYVDGYIRGEWLKGGHEIPLKFHRKKSLFVHSAKLRAEAKEALKKRRLDKGLRDFYQSAFKSILVWEPSWTTPMSFIRHIRKSCTSIELIKMGYGD